MGACRVHVGISMHAPVSRHAHMVPCPLHAGRWGVGRTLKPIRVQPQGGAATSWHVDLSRGMKRGARQNSREERERDSTLVSYEDSLSSSRVKKKRKRGETQNASLSLVSYSRLVHPTLSSSAPSPLFLPLSSCGLPACLFTCGIPRLRSTRERSGCRTV